MSVRIERPIRLYNRLRRGPVTIEIISKWAQGAGIRVSDRQLYRDLNTLKDLRIAEGENVVEYADEKNRKSRKLEYAEGEEKLTQFDINAFFLLKNVVPYSVIEQRKHSIEKFENILYRHLSKNKYQQFIEANKLYLRRTNYMENLYGEIEHKQIDDLSWALNNKRIIAIEQDLLNAANLHLPPNAYPLSMYPLELVFHRGRIPIAGLSTTNRQFVIFTVDKSLIFRPTNGSFNRKPLLAGYEQAFDRLFGISDPPDKRTYRIKIEFTKSYGESYMNYFWHHSQRWERLKNGNYLLHLHCGIGRELVGFLTEGPNKSKVRQPKILCTLVCQQLKETVAVYEHDLAIDEEESNVGYC